LSEQYFFFEDLKSTISSSQSGFFAKLYLFFHNNKFKLSNIMQIYINYYITFDEYN